MRNPHNDDVPDRTDVESQNIVDLQFMGYFVKGTIMIDDLLVAVGNKGIQFIQKKIHQVVLIQ